MKVTAIILAGTIGMAGCTMMGHNRGGQGLNSSYLSDETCSPGGANVNKPNTYIDPSTTNSCHDGKVPVLDPDIEKIVGKAAGVNHVAFIAVVSSNGERPGILRPNSAIKSRRIKVDKPGQLTGNQEIPATAIKGMGSIGIVSFRGSHCIAVWPMVDGGGQRYDICLMRDLSH